jgi:hypothetical protein
VRLFRPSDLESLHADCTSCSCSLTTGGLWLRLLLLLLLLQAWVSARKASDFSQFKDYLQQWVDISLQKAAAIDPSKPAYDVSCNTAGRPWQLSALALRALVSCLLAWLRLCRGTFCMFNANA